MEVRKLYISNFCMLYVCGKSFIHTKYKSIVMWMWGQKNVGNIHKDQEFHKQKLAKGLLELILL